MDELHLVRVKQGFSDPAHLQEERCLSGPEGQQVALPVINSWLQCYFRDGAVA